MLRTQVASNRCHPAKVKVDLNAFINAAGYDDYDDTNTISIFRDLVRLKGKTSKEDAFGKKLTGQYRSTSVDIDIEALPKAVVQHANSDFIKFKITGTLKAKAEFYDGDKWQTIMNHNKVGLTLADDNSKGKKVESIGTWNGMIMKDKGIHKYEYTTNQGKTRFTDKTKFPKTPKRGDSRTELHLTNVKVFVEAFRTKKPVKCL